MPVLDQAADDAIVFATIYFLYVNALLIRVGISFKETRNRLKVIVSDAFATLRPADLCPTRRLEVLAWNLFVDYYR